MKILLNLLLNRYLYIIYYYKLKTIVFFIHYYVWIGGRVFSDEHSVFRIGPTKLCGLQCVRPT